jgi:hypothetical protein
MATLEIVDCAQTRAGSMRVFLARRFLAGQSN